MTKQPFDNPTSQAERREITKNDVTFHKFALNDPRPGGRFATLNKNSTTGAAPIPTYPALPETSPWAQWPPESIGGDPLGFSVEDHPPVGSPEEIAASIERLGERQAPNVVRSPTLVGDPLAQSPLRRRRI